MLVDWNALIDVCDSNTEFNCKLLAKVRPNRKSVYKVRNVHGIRCLTKLRLRFSPLNEHKFWHNFDCLNPICICNAGIEDNEHFLLHCPLYDLMRDDLLGHLSEIPGLEPTNISSKALCDLLLFGNEDLTVLTKN